MAYTTFVLPFRPVFDSNGLPVPGAGLNFYLTGTVIRTPVYADSALTTELPNPVVANSAGRFVDIYMDAAVIYRVTVTDDSGVVLDDADPYSFGNAGVGVDLISTQTISGAKTFSSNITIPNEVYGVGWDADMGAPTKNAVYDKIETITTVTDEVYGVGWDGNLGSPTKNAVYDKIETLTGKWTLLSTTTIAGATANVTQTGLSSYQDILIVLNGVSHDDTSASKSVSIYYSTDGTTFPVFDQLTTSSLYTQTPTNIAFLTTVAGQTSFFTNFAGSPSIIGNARILGAVLSAIRLQWTGGSFDAGTIKIYAR